MLMIPSCRSACQRPNHRRMRPSWLPLTYAVNAVHINGWGPTDWNWDAKKTQLIWIRTGQQLAKLTVTQLQLINSVVELDSTATNLGVVLDGQLSVSQQVTAVCRSCFYELRQLKSVKSSLTREALHSLIQAFVHCRIDYCNSALAGVANVYLQKLQSVQNMAARMVSVWIAPKWTHRHSSWRSTLATC